MITAADLLKPIAPFYTTYKRADTHPKYPPDENRKRWCPKCGYLPIKQFRSYGGKMRRDCIACTNRKAAAKRAKRRGG